ncbi:PRC-barrel domain-containing protein [Allopusillimonas ginsengisoli]|uniref:PRC-barrel domain-containing protein n=1 Tax=Allopusillimonas ginsengisoli TaxID=453575 RepID=UPI00101FD150|nr:PRC-barrel domain-containing protein [Allopusillimonas ginsengisoli]TEA79643.1 PRC-barrel domain containing protein [Allopusillimonas ginsengisoli]
MKKLIAVASCSLPMIFAPVLYAQTQPDAAAGDASGATSAPAPNDPAAAGTAPAPDTAPAPAPDTGAPAAPGAAAPMPGGEAAPAAPEEQTEAISGWSVKDNIMGKAVFNENDEKIGDISDVVLSSEGQAAYFIVGAGGFLGVGARDVAIPYDKITQTEDKLVLPGYTKDQLKALPKVEVAK